MSKIRVLIVEPGKEVYEAKIENTVGTMQNIIKGYMKIVELEDGVGLIITRKGKLLNLPFNRYITGNMLVGTVIVTGFNKGETMSLSPEMIEKYKKYFALRNHEHLVDYFTSIYGNSMRLARVSLAGGCCYGRC